MAPTNVVCTSCEGKFAAFAFNSNISICRWCDVRQHLLAELQSEREAREALQTRVDTLLARLEVVEVGRGTDVVDTPGLVVGTAAVPSTPASPAPAPPAFVPVRRGAHPSRLRKPRLPIVTTNRFSIPGFEDPEEPEIRLVGDSIIRGQLEAFCGRNPRRRRRYCYPGSRVEDVTNAISDFTGDAPDDCGYVVHVGTNNVLNYRSEELLQKYKQMVVKLKEKTNKIIISGILPRMDDQDNFSGRAIYINNNLKSLCQREGVSFADHWAMFLKRRDLFQRDGVHLNAVGAARLGRLLNNSLSFLQV